MMTRTNSDNGPLSWYTDIVFPSGKSSGLELSKEVINLSQAKKLKILHDGYFQQLWLYNLKEAFFVLIDGYRAKFIVEFESPHYAGYQEVFNLDLLKELCWEDDNGIEHDLLVTTEENKE